MPKGNNEKKGYLPDEEIERLTSMITSSGKEPYECPECGRKVLQGHDCASFPGKGGDL